MARYLLATLALLAANSSNAFTVNSNAKINTNIRSLQRKTSLHMSDDKNVVKVTTKTGFQEKEIAYDEKTGRFFETDLECVPGDEYCVVDQESGQMVRLTLEEKERIFMDALQSYYVSGKNILSDSEFDLLKEDLSWAGSKVVAMSSKEIKFISAKQAYMKGESIISDAEFDTLKKELKEEGSSFAVDLEPKCYIDTGMCKVTFQKDSFRNNLLYLPAGVILYTLWLGLGYELFSAIIPLNPIILIVLGAFPVFAGSKAITEGFIFPGNYVAYGPCPACGTNNRIYFGNILGVEGFKDVGSIKCTNCKEMINVSKGTLRASTMPKSMN